MRPEWTIYQYNHQTYKWELTDRPGRDCWVDKDGNIFNCTAHEVYAEYIVNELFGLEEVQYGFGDYLIDLGWVKFTTSCMNDIYKKNGLYDNLTPAQAKIYSDYFDFY